MASSDERTRARLNTLEVEARTRPRRHALRLLGLACLGYLYPGALLVVSFLLVIGILSIGWLAWDSTTFAVIILYSALLVGSVVIVAAILRTFWVTLPTPTSPELAPGEAPALRDLLEQVRQAVGAPPIHHIHIDERLNAAVSQRPRFGFWGPRTNYLIIGLPLLMVMTPEQIRVVLAHELGHVRGRHNSFSSWIY